MLTRNSEGHACGEAQGTSRMHPYSLLYEHLFRDLPSASREAFQAIATRKSYPSGAQVFVRGQLASGIFILHSGHVMLCEDIGEAQPPSSPVAGPGEILGVAAAVSGDRHRLEARALEPCVVGFIDREDLMYFLRVDGAAAFRLVQMLSHGLDAALEYARLLPPFHEA